MAESIAYGEMGGDEYIITLFIDDGKQVKGHRESILSPLYNLTGMAVCPHPKHGQEVVILYAVSFTPNEYGEGQLAQRAKY